MAKPRKVQEPAATYGTKAPAAPGRPDIRLVKLKDVQKLNAKLMQVHRKVLQKLAQ
jgi:hypothetical protein